MTQLSDGRRGLAWRIKEWQLGNGGGNGVPDGFDGEFHFEPGANL